MMEEVIAKSSESTRFYRSALRESTLPFGTKAETLERLSPLVQTCSIPDLLYFTLGEWSAGAERVLDRIRQRFGLSSLAVRSSAYHEDTAAESMAGAFRSVLRVDGACRESLRREIDGVLESYHSAHPHNQVLVQPMLSNVVMSGVLMTHDLTNGAPYYILNYDDESGRTDVITGGTDVNKSLVVHRDTPSDFIESPG